MYLHSPASQPDYVWVPQNNDQKKSYTINGKTEKEETSHGECQR